MHSPVPDAQVVAPATAGSVPTDHSGLAVVTCSFSQVELRATRITRTDSTRSHPSLVVGVVLSNTSMIPSAGTEVSRP